MSWSQITKVSMSILFSTDRIECWFALMSKNHLVWTKKSSLELLDRQRSRFLKNQDWMRLLFKSIGMDEAWISMLQMWRKFWNCLLLTAILYNFWHQSYLSWRNYFLFTISIWLAFSEYHCTKSKSRTKKIWGVWLLDWPYQRNYLWSPILY